MSGYFSERIIFHVSNILNGKHFLVKIFCIDFKYSPPKKPQLSITFIYMEIFLWIGFLQLNASAISILDSL